MTFFFDNNLSPAVVRGLRGFGEDVRHLTELFTPNTPDVEWLKRIGNENWILVTRDERVRRNPAELNAFKRYNVRAFFLGGKNRTRCDMIQQIVRNWPRMKEFANRLRPPFAFRIPPSGTKFSKLTL